MASIAFYLYWIYTQGLYMHIIRGTLPLDAPHNMIYTPCFFTYKFRQLLVSPYASVFLALSGSVPKISMPYGLCQVSAFSLLSFPESKKGLYTLVSKASSGSAPKIPMYIAPVFCISPVLNHCNAPPHPFSDQENGRDYSGDSKSKLKPPWQSL